jgi:GDPmannose 4,6-dehydratase
VDLLVGDAAKARQQLNWAPEVDFKGLVTMMVDADLARNGAEVTRVVPPAAAQEIQSNEALELLRRS